MADIDRGENSPHPHYRRPLLLALAAAVAAVPLAVASDLAACRVRAARVEAHAATAAELVAFADQAGLVHSARPAERTVYVRCRGH